MLMRGHGIAAVALLEKKIAGEADNRGRVFRVRTEKEDDGTQGRRRPLDQAPSRCGVERLPERSPSGGARTPLKVRWSETIRVHIAGFRDARQPRGCLNLGNLC